MKPLKTLPHLVNKYRQVALFLATEKGSVFDIGARNRILSTYLINKENFSYFSADAIEGCDYVIDLEKKLSFDDRSFDHVIALDVLEHVETAHEAFAELVRISRQTVIIALPNMATLRHRLAYLLKGHLATDKYDFRSTHQGDRHRWLTVYPQIMQVFEAWADQHNLTLELVTEEVAVNWPRPLSALWLYLHLPARSAHTERCTAFFRRRS